MPDNTDLLIEKLVASHRAVTPFAAAPILLLSVLLVVAGALTILFPLGIRADWGAAAILKSAALLALTTAVLKLTLLVSGPAQPSWRQAWGFLLIILLSLGLFTGFATKGAALSLQEATAISSFWVCVAWVSLVGGGAVVILHRLLRRARPGQRQVMRLAVSLCAALLAATVYSLHCPVDALAYLLTAYLLATAIIVGFGWLLSRRLWCW